MIFIHLDMVIRIHERVIADFGGLHGIHDLGLLESAINHPLMMLKFGTIDDCEIHNLAAAYFYHIIKNHPFNDGNKRTGLLTALDFIYMNGFELEGKFEDIYEELYTIALDTAASRTNKKEIASFFKTTMRKVD